MVIFQKRIPGATETSLDRFITRAKRVAGLRGSVSVLITSSRELRTLNRRFRRKDKPTDVLSFPAEPSASRKSAGEIAIAADIATQNALQFGHMPFEEIKILALHGILHLAGYDHEIDGGEMARREIELRKQFRLPVALIERHGREIPGSRNHSAEGSRRRVVAKPSASTPPRRSR
jgi:probable rRNA maturation factor